MPATPATSATTPPAAAKAPKAPKSPTSTKETRAARRRAWRARWLEVTVVIAAIAAAAVCLAGAWHAPLELAPLLAVPPALAGVGATTVWRPLGYGAAALAAGVIIDALLTGGITVTTGSHQLALAALGATAVVTILSLIGTKVGAEHKTTQQAQQALQIVNVTSVAEAAQRAVLRQLPETVGPLSVGVVYLAAAAEARVGGDLYEVVDTTEHGIRMIIGDVRGKGLEAVEVAADIIGRFRELAHGVHTLDEIAYRLDAGLTRRWGKHEEFVTALLAQVDPERGRLTILNCGHPPPILVSAAGEVTVLEVRAPAPPLGLITLGNDSGAKQTYAFEPNDQLLLYTDGVTEARDADREFYPLEGRVAALAPQTLPKAAKTPLSPRAAARQLSRGGPSLLDLVRDDLLRHVGSPPHDDAAMLLIRAPASWPDTGAGARRGTAATGRLP
ncbi:MAG TPA: PP2C family protein-serine/threonine phosphatase [Trebonia sp.]|nr:PP2C family protein-serine/threonine phosphatase [Trebonia sp.]